MVPYSQRLFNLLVDIGHFPDCWSEGYLAPIHKKGSLNNVENYRGITLLSVLGKLFTQILNNSKYNGLRIITYILRHKRDFVVV